MTVLAFRPGGPASCNTLPLRFILADFVVSSTLNC